MPRLPYHDLKGLPEDLTRMLAERPPLNLYRMMPHAASLMPGFLKMGFAIRTETELDPKIRELVILRAGTLMGSSYEVFQHRRIAAKVGALPGEIEAAVTPSSVGGLDSKAALALEFTEAVVKEVRVPDALFARVKDAFGERQLCEMLLTAGFYMMVSRFLENTGVEIESPPVT
jgi:4-carboxymuconolactone decarboxylase